MIIDGLGWWWNCLLPTNIPNPAAAPYCKVFNPLNKTVGSLVGVDVHHAPLRPKLVEFFNCTYSCTRVEREDALRRRVCSASTRRVVYMAVCCVCTCRLWWRQVVVKRCFELTSTLTFLSFLLLLLLCLSFCLPQVLASSSQTSPRR